jgi:hypothetical protein
MTPNEYARLYRRIEVPCPDGTTVPVNISKYLSSLTRIEAKDRLWGQIGAEFIRSKSIPVKVFTNGAWVEHTFQSKGEMVQHVVGPYCGKASPESVQVILQLILRLDPKKVTKETVQAYCDEHLGLDCNGFVGNYLRHGKDGRPWTDVQKRGDRARGPSTDIATMVGTRFVKKPADLKFTDLYVLGMVDKDNRVLPGGGKGTGHVVAVQPFTLVDKVSPFGQDKCYTPGFAKDPAKNPSFWTVESTGGIGLTASWYNVVSVDKAGIFTVYRGCKASKFRVRVAPVLPAV